MEVDAVNGTSGLGAGLWAVTCGGILRVIKVAGEFAPGQRWKLFDAPGTYYSAFDAVEPAAPGPGLAWDLSRLAADGALGAVSAEEVSCPEFVRRAHGLQLNWRGSYRLQVPTYALNPGLNHDWVDYPATPGTGVIIPLTPAALSDFFRLVNP